MLIRGRLVSFHEDVPLDIPDGALRVEDGRIAALGPFAEVARPGEAVDDHRGRLILPGLIDPHIHFPQLQVVASWGTELLDWLNRYTFPAEARFADPAHAAVMAPRFLDALPDDAYDLILFDCPPAIGYQSMNAVFAADMLYIPSGPGYWEYDSTTSFIGQLAEALADLSHGFADFPAGKISLPKAFADIRFLMTRYEPSNELHQAMFNAFRQVFGDRLAQHPIELTRAVEQSGRFLSSIYEIDYRQMTRGTWRRARASFDQAYEEFRTHALAAWDKLEDAA